MVERQSKEKESRQKREKRRDTEGVWIYSQKKKRREWERVVVSSFGREDEGKSLSSGKGE